MKNKKQTIKMTKPDEDELKIIDSNVGSNLGILLVNDNDIDRIRRNTGKLAKDNEYQVHYWALIIRFKYKDESFMDLSIPTVYYNYKQDVSSAHIDFDLNDVDDTGKQIEPLHNSKVNSLFESKSFNELIRTIKETYDFDSYEYLSNHLQSIHKHPSSGKYDSFSGTDYDKDPSNPGIVFPFGSIEEERIEPSFASIIHNSQRGAYIAHSEYRIAYQKDNKITYEKHKCLTYAYKENNKISTISKMLGNKETLEAYMLGDEISEQEEKTLDISNLLYYFMETSKFKADTDLIDSENVSEKKYIPSKFGSKVQGLFGSSINSKKKKYIIPSRNSEEWNKVFNYAKSFYEIELFDYKDINKLSQDAKNVYYENLYFELNSEKAKVKNVETLDIMKLQNEFVEFIYDEMQFYSEEIYLDDEAFIEEMDKSYQGTKLKGN